MTVLLEPVTIYRPTGEDHRVLPVSLLDAKAYLRIEHDEEDRGLLLMIMEAVHRVESFIETPLIYRSEYAQFGEFPSECVEIPLKKVRSVTSVKYYDADDVQQTIDPGEYRFLLTLNFPQIEPVSGWPSAGSREDAVEIEIVRGFSDRPSGIPGDILAAVMMLIAQRYRYREGLAYGQAEDLTESVRACLSEHIPLHA